MKEIGGYIEIEYSHGKEFHPEAIALNCGRNCLAYLIEAYQIKKIYLPYFLCSSVSNVCKKYSVEIEYYNINEAFLPVIPTSLKKDDWLYVVNYYGQLSVKELLEIKMNAENLIIDNAQNFFGQSLNDVPTIYTCRKFFGVSDGAYLYSNKIIERPLEIDYSYERMHFLMGRFEKTANEFYSEYNENNHFFVTEPIKQMSRLTHNFLKSIDYDFVKKQRTDNYNYLYDKLVATNKLKLGKTEGPFAYPLLLEDGDNCRKALQQKKIYIPTLWPDVFSLCNERSLEYHYAKNILPIPVDQRYLVTDMEYILENLEKEEFV